MNSQIASIRLIQSDDAEVLAKQLALDAVANVRWDPVRPAEYYTINGQSHRIEQLLTDHREGTRWSGVVLDGDVIVGQVTVSGILRHAFQKAPLGYWIVSTRQGQGHATRTVTQVLRVMTEELNLHRVEASTQADNLASQQVLRTNGFTQIGFAHSQHLH